MKFQASMQAVGRKHESSPELLQILQSKLPLYHQDRWGRKVHQIQKDKHQEATLEYSIERMNEEVEISSDPLFSREAISEMFRREPQRPLRPKAHTTATCNCNRRWHDLEKCPTFKDLERKAKLDHLYKQPLYFSCLQPTSRDHMARTCKTPRFLIQTIQPDSSQQWPY